MPAMFVPQECEALGVVAPALTQLDDIAADIAAVKSSWVVYQEFLAERDELAHRDWLSMRDQVGAATFTGSGSWAAVLTELCRP